VILSLNFMELAPLQKMFDPATFDTRPVDATGLKGPTYAAHVGDPDSDTGKNATARSTLIPAMLCPTDSTANHVPFDGSVTGEFSPTSTAPGQPASGQPKWARGNYAVNSGSGFMGFHGGNASGFWDAKDPQCAAWSDTRYRGVMGPNSCTMPITSITDGTSTTFLVGEVRAGITNRDRRGTWAMGAAGASIVAAYGWGTGGNDAGDDNGPNFCAWEADSIYGADLAPPNGFNDLADPNDCMHCHSGAESWQATMRSLHPNGLNAVMVDASVHFISNNIETGGQGAAWPTNTNRNELKGYNPTTGAPIYDSVPDVGGMALPVWDRLILSADGMRVDSDTAGF
jgi:hypothetical protein